MSSSKQPKCVVRQVSIASVTVIGHWCRYQAKMVDAAYHDYATRRESVTVICYLFSAFHVISDCVLVKERAQQLCLSTCLQITCTACFRWKPYLASVRDICVAFVRRCFSLLLAHFVDLEQKQLKREKKSGSMMHHVKNSFHIWKNKIGTASSSSPLFYLMLHFHRMSVTSADFRLMNVFLLTRGYVEKHRRFCTRKLVLLLRQFSGDVIAKSLTVCDLLEASILIRGCFW